MALSRRSTLVGLSAAAFAALSGTLSSRPPQRFERLSVSVSGPGSLWVGTLGFRDVDGAERWEDLYGLGDVDYLAPADFRVHERVTELYTPVEFVAAPMAGHDPADPLSASLSTDDAELASGTVTGLDDAITLTLE
ncbi:hypothetical protein [Halorubellus sp. PRR65]|uniref:hypothetical protein n=1 Tax=Halorubellus sp. PRR65 TaxID=3098148 RepID=UPI002B25A26D|nr:hypothetical protein [Halorubellus sp. PRR65]